MGGGGEKERGGGQKKNEACRGIGIIFNGRPETLQEKFTRRKFTEAAYDDRIKVRLFCTFAIKKKKTSKKASEALNLTFCFVVRVIFAITMGMTWGETTQTEKSIIRRLKQIIRYVIA